MPLSYMTTEEARARLIAFGYYTEENAPSIERLTLIMSSVEALVNEWLNFNPAVQDYEERLLTNEDGVCYMSHYPVLTVIKVAIYHEQIPGYLPSPLSSTPSEPSFGLPDPSIVYTEKTQITSIWKQDRRLYLSGASQPLLVNYRAGFDPLPPIFKETFANVLEEVVRRSGLGPVNLGFLSQPTSDVTSLGLPGGLSKSFQYGKSSGEGSSSKFSGTALERLLSPLTKYRRTIVVRAAS